MPAASSERVRRGSWAFATSVSVTMPKRRPGNCRMSRSPAVSSRRSPMTMSYARSPSGTCTVRVSAAMEGLGGYRSAAQMGNQRVDDVPRDLVLRHVGGDDGDVGLSVDRIARLDQRLECGAGIFRLQQW